jgi:hypothetical protein
LSTLLLKTIKWRKLTLILSIVSIASAIVAFTACVSLGAFHTMTNLLSTNAGSVMIVYGANARSPQTSVISLAVYNELISTRGVEAVSPEVVSVAVLPSGKPVVVRGVDPRSVKGIIEFKVLDGAFISGDRYFEAAAGLEASRRLDLKTGDRILLRSVLTRNYIEVEIVGVYESVTSLDDEILVPIQTAQWLRGLPPNAVSMMRVKIDEELLPREKLSEALGGKDSGGEVASKASRIISLLFSASTGNIPSRLVIREASESMQEFLGRETKLNEASFWSITILVFAGSISTIALAPTLFILDHAREISIIKSIGGVRRIQSAVLPVVLVSSFLAGLAGSMMGYLLSKAFSESSLLVVGTYTIKPAMSMIIPLVSAGLTSIVAVVTAKIATDSVKTEAWIG